MVTGENILVLITGGSGLIGRALATSLTHDDVEVIILTGHGSEKDRELAMELGAFAYLEKPVDIEILTKTMKEAYEKINASK